MTPPNETKMPELPEPFDTIVWGEFSQNKAPVYSAGQMRAYAEATLAAAAGGHIPDIWKLVPIEPNWDMRNEGREFLIGGLEKNPEKMAYFLWKTMVAAAPEVK